MSENPTIKTTQSLEAPASWNTRYLSPEGFVCQLTLRADSGRELLEKAQAAIAHLTEAGCMPGDAFTNRPKSNGNGHKAPDNDAAAGNGNAHLCPVHGVEMRRWDKNNHIWYSHKTESGNWCSGKSKSN